MDQLLYQAREGITVASKRAAAAILEQQNQFELTELHRIENAALTGCFSHFNNQNCRS